jgi:mRNA-degrading endonuclease RelE of RelBE toxin-antitoxin system
MAQKDRSFTQAYRVGDHRLICSLKDDLPAIMVLRIGHRNEIYSR